MPKIILEEAQTRLQELDKKSRQLEEDLQKHDESKAAISDLGAID